MPEESMWLRAKDWFAEKHANLHSDPAGFARQYMQEPRLEPWQKDAVQTITGWDLASPDGDWSVRWNNKIGRYERRRAGGRWEAF